MNKKYKKILTDYAEVEELTHLRFRGYLALVLTGVSLLHVLDHQVPGLQLSRIVRLEPLVAYEGVPIHRQDVSVSHPYPGYLWRGRPEWNESLGTLGTSGKRISKTLRQVCLKDLAGFRSLEMYWV